MIFTALPLSVLPVIAAVAFAPGAITPAKAARVGAYRDIDLANSEGRDEAEAARDAVQKYFVPSFLKIVGIEKAASQVVAGMNFKLQCKVTGPGGVSTFQFVIWKQLDGTWVLTSAKRL